MKNSAQPTAATISTGVARVPAVGVAQPKMKAVAYDVYGAFDVLQLRDIDRPVVRDDQVLVRVRAAGLHVGDVFGVHGAPFAMRLVSGLFKPTYGVPGFDLAGVVEAVGKRVTRFRPGDEVFGVCNGACAEYACARADQLAPKPASLTFQQAAALPTSALAALHAVRDVAKLRPGHKLLINGASGGIGTFAIQLAKAFGAEVTGVCSTKNIDLVRSLGADHVIDYTRDDFTQRATRYDLILDNIENRSLADCRRALTPDGTLILNSGTGAFGLSMLFRIIKPLLLSPFLRQNLSRYVSVPNQADLAVLAQHVESGALKPVIEQTYSLHEVATALARIETGRVSGKLVVSI